MGVFELWHLGLHMFLDRLEKWLHVEYFRNIAVQNSRYLCPVGGFSCVYHRCSNSGKSAVKADSGFMPVNCVVIMEMEFFAM